MARPHTEDPPNTANQGTSGSKPINQGSTDPDSIITGKTILSAADIARVIDRVAHQILEKTDGAREVILLGIPTRGFPMACRLAERIRAFEGTVTPTGVLDVTLYRDDLSMRAARALGHTDIPPGGVDGKRVILVDDVLFSGRTARAALDALQDLGRPRAVQLAVLVDRGHRELPIRADYVGKNIPTSLAESVKVRLREIDGVDAVTLRALGVAAGAAGLPPGGSTLGEGALDHDAGDGGTP